MFGNSRGRSGEGTSFYHSISGLATTLALFAALVATPVLYSHTVDPLTGYLTSVWGHQFSFLFKPIIAILEAAAIYWSSKAALSVAATFLLVTAVSRGWVFA